MTFLSIPFFFQNDANLGYDIKADLVDVPIPLYYRHDILQSMFYSFYRYEIKTLVFHALKKIVLFHIQWQSKPNSCKCLKRNQSFLRNLHKKLLNKTHNASLVQ